MNWAIDLRPNDFDEVYGNDKIKEYFANLQKTKKDYANAYLFQGHYGNSKTTLAYIVMKHMMCLHKKDTGHICKKGEECVNCLSINRQLFNQSDMLFINGAEAGKDDIIDQVKSFTQISGTFGSPRRVCLIDEAQELSSSAVKALLNILETPRKKLHFIFTSMGNTDGAVKTGTGKEVPNSINSRCQTFRVNKATDLEIMFFLKAQYEKLGLNIQLTDCKLPEFFNCIGINANGSYRKALQMLEQAVDSNITSRKELSEVMGITDDYTIDICIKKMLNGQTDDGVFQLINTQQGESLNQIVGLFSKIIADVKVYKLFGKTNDERDFIQKQAAAYACTNNFYIFEECFDEFMKNTGPYLRRYDWVKFIESVYKRINTSTNITPSGVTKEKEEEPVRRTVKRI